MHPDDLPICVNYFQRVLATGQKQNAIEYRIKHKNGSWQWHTSNSSAIKDANGNFLYFVGICHDTSDRKHAQEELAQRSQLANFRADVDAARWRKPAASRFASTLKKLTLTKSFILN
ncbi:MAG: PAS domain-containing protein [Nostoc indistinguendum CM1-VF10]|jgi:hypothetical protein|nr:PAS domain-containing protein [Nostoc sp. FACHB-888]MBW4451683.1 PAS domain-containing protein [Nostoc indistinguendum CM1-VF10]